MKAILKIQDILILHCFKLLTVLATTLALDYCPQNGHKSEFYECAVFIRENVKSWGDAMFKCELLGGTLVKIETDAQNSYLREKMGPSEFWTGLNDIDDPWQYVWSDRSKLISQEWNTPYKGAIEGETCVVSAPEMWNAISCEQVKPFVCQIISNIVPVDEVAITNGARLLNGQAQLEGVDAWNSRALMATLTLEDESLCALYCLYTELCVSMAYKKHGGRVNCLLYSVDQHSQAPLWKWNLYEIRVVGSKEILNARSAYGPYKFGQNLRYTQ